MPGLLDSTARAATRPAGRAGDWLDVSLNPSKSARPVVGWVVVAAGFVGLASLAGCSGIEPVAPYQSPVTDPTQLYTQLRVDYRVLTLSTDPSCQCATWQLTATPRDAQDSAMGNLPAPTFSPLNAGDTTTVRVTADGKVTALQEGTTQILAELGVGNVRHADTIFIEVKNPTPRPTLASVSIDPLSPDSAFRPLHNVYNSEIHFAVELALEAGIGYCPFTHCFLLNESDRSFALTPRVLDMQGNSVTDLAFDFEALDPAIAAMTPAADRRTARWGPLSPGQARFVVRTTAYGVTVVDTTVFTVTLPAFTVVQAQPKPGDSSIAVFAPQEVHIRPNGMVFLANLLGHPVDVTFDDPTNVIEPPAAMCNFMDNFFAFAGFDLYGPAPNCAAGNFTLAPLPLTGPAPGFPPVELTFEVRRFPVAGVYSYHSTSTGATGRIVVE